MGNHEKDMDRAEAIINSMTLKERRNPGILNGGRRARIAGGSGTRVQDVNQLLKQFEQMRKMVQSLLQPGKRQPRLPVAGGPPGGWLPDGMGGMPALPGMNTGRGGKSAAEKKRDKQKRGKQKRKNKRR
jgi:signal recognition particle subunit SRP54